jgi:hypothetical protein
LISRNKSISYGEGLLAPRAIPKLEDHPLSSVRDCLFNISAAALHPQPEDAPCCGDRDPTNMASLFIIDSKINEDVMGRECSINIPTPWL